MSEACEIIDLAGYRAAPQLLQMAGAAAAAAMAVEPALLGAPGRGRARSALARQVQVYLVHVGFGIDLATLGRSVGRDRSTLGHACAIVEDRRDDGRFDAAMGVLEASLRRWARTFLEVRP
jgi:hypothetical protein